MLAHGIDHDQGLGLVLLQLGNPAGDLFIGNMQGTDDMPGGEILLPTHVEYQALLTVDQRGQLAAAQALPAFTGLGEGQQCKQAEEHCAQNIVGRDKFNQVGKHCAVPGR